MQDALDLSHYRMHEQATVGCNYHGTLKNDPSAVVAVTGCLNKPGDKMEVTLISKNNINKMFEVDFDGSAEIIKNPFAEGAQSGALKARDDGWHEEGGDEEKNDEEENAAHNVRTTSIPSKLKATIQFGYEAGMKEALGGEDFDAWVQTVMVHARSEWALANVQRGLHCHQPSAHQVPQQGGMPAPLRTLKNEIGKVSVTDRESHVLCRTTSASLACVSAPARRSFVAMEMLRLSIFS